MSLFGVDHHQLLRVGFKVTWMNLEARTWSVDVQATTALEHIILIRFSWFLNFASSGGTFVFVLGF